MSGHRIVNVPLGGGGGSQQVTVNMISLWLFWMGAVYEEVTF